MDEALEDYYVRGRGEEAVPQGQDVEVRRVLLPAPAEARKGGPRRLIPEPGGAASDLNPDP